MNTTFTALCCFFSEGKAFDHLIFQFSKTVEGGMSTTTEESVLDLLPKFRFHPSEEEMVNLLKNKVEGQDSQAMPDEIVYKPRDLPDNESIQLFRCFLKRMMQGKASQSIPEIDVYKYEPWDLAELMFPDSPYQPRAWFSFSRPDYKYANSPRCNRATGKGFWKITGKPRQVKSRQLPKSVTCKKRTLTFHEGRVSKSRNTGWVRQEYYLTPTDPGSNPNQLSGFVLCRMKNKSTDNESDNKKQQDVSICVESADPGITGCMASNSELDQAAGIHLIPEAEEHLTYKELEHVLLGSGNQNDGEPGGFVSSDFDDMIQELCAKGGEYLDSPSPPERPRQHQLPQLGNVPLCAQLGEELDSPFPPPGPPELGNAPYVYTDECSSWPSPIGDNDSSLPNKNSIPTNYDSKPVSNTASNFENQTRSSEVYSQAEENLESFFRQFELEGDFLHANNYIGCNESQSATLFPRSS
ncbi:NAC domain-containing protein 68 [Prunus yedoensis var. nudiflora]|uniref:NAC domain-containing protein 68 n=1 Tax=Prunus yedoensis var. nudiflora TaxID=2094558 RepID=A0A314ZVK6_PRUYE|nr:NAC domain-containing protein 68 [Prunus yedoensis var. nudiflora]